MAEEQKAYHNDDEEATPEEIKGVVWTVVSIVAVFGILISLGMAIIL